MSELTPVGPAYVYRATCDRVIDGDTFIARIDLGFRVSCSLTVRVRGVDTPEIVGETRKEGIAARTWTTLWLYQGDLLICSYKDRQSFARWVCDVWRIESDGSLMLLADALVAAGHGVIAV